MINCMDMNFGGSTTSREEANGPKNPIRPDFGLCLRSLVAMRCVLVLLLATAVAYGATLLATPDHVQVYEEVTLAWVGISNPSSRDVVALFSPADAPATALPLLATNVSMVSSVGGMIFALLNMRNTFQFRYLQPVAGSNFTNFTQVAASNVITTDPNQPMQGHLALTAQISQMRVALDLLPMLSLLFLGNVGVRPELYRCGAVGYIERTVFLECDNYPLHVQPGSG